MKVGIAGCGGIGSNVAYHLIRSGIINFKFGDFDIVEISNLNRQFFFHSQIGKAKALCLKENLLQINPKAIIEAEIIHFEKENIQNFFYDCDIIIEAFDKKECKTMLLEEISTTGKPIIAASGIADYDIENLQIKKLSSNLYVVGDFMKGIENYPTYSHKVNMVAAMMAKVVLDLGGYFEKRIEIPKGIYGITGDNFSNGKSNLDCVKEMIEGGIRILQYRDKTKSMLEKYQEAKEIAKLCKEKGVIFIINDHVDLALLVNADGVHIGQDDYPVEEVRALLGNDKIIGLSTHSPEQGFKAFQNENVDYIGVGPIFPTTTKDTKAVGLEYLDFAVQNLHLPFVAIGGIQEENLEKILARKVEHFCMVSGIVGAKNIRETVQNLWKQWEENQ